MNNIAFGQDSRQSLLRPFAAAELEPATAAEMSKVAVVLALVFLPKLRVSVRNFCAVEYILLLLSVSLDDDAQALGGCLLYFEGGA